MKKRILLIISFICLFIFQYVTYANNPTKVYLNANKINIEKNEEFEISMVIENSKISAFLSYIYFDDSKVEYLSGPENTNIIDNQIITVWYDETGGNNSIDGELARFKFKAKENGNVVFNVEGEFYDTEGKIIQTNFEEFKISIGEIVKETTNDGREEIAEYIKSDNTNLEILAVENEFMNPSFDANIINYDVEVSNKKNYLNILAVPENENAKIEITGNEELKVGDNLITITVTGEDKVSKKVYKINVKQRNQEEEKVYEKEQEANKEKLEEIYQAEKVNKEIKEVKNNNIIEFQERENNKQIQLAVILGIIFCIVFIVIIILKKRKYCQ